MGPTYVLAYVIFALVGYNLSKLLWYLSILPVPESGLHASMPLHFTGYRGPKLQSHPVLFLSLHTIMGSTLLFMFAYYHLLSPTTAPDAVNVAFFALSAVFALHAVPERSGVPNRLRGKPINEIAIAWILISVALFFTRLMSPSTGWSITFVPLIAAAVLELKAPIADAVKGIKTGNFVSKSPDTNPGPLPRNMAGYSGCPFSEMFEIGSPVGVPGRAPESKRG